MSYVTQWHLDADYSHGIQSRQRAKERVLLLFGGCQVDVTPSTFVLDGNGHLVGFVRGYIDWADPAVPAYFEKLAEKYADRSKKVAK